MSSGYKWLHSHSGLERKLLFPKGKVLVDVEYGDLFVGKPTESFSYDGVEYLKVPILAFVNKGGVFKNFDK